jgi:pyruvate kinase
MHTLLLALKLQSCPLPALTSEDIDNLNFIVKNATAAGLSFAHSPDDIKNLHEKLSSIEKPDFGIIAKVETSDAVTNLAKVLLAGLDLPNFGILLLLEATLL